MYRALFILQYILFYITDFAIRYSYGNNTLMEVFTNSPQELCLLPINIINSVIIYSPSINSAVVYINLPVHLLAQ